MNKALPLHLGLFLLGCAVVTSAHAASAVEDAASPWSVEASAGVEYDDNVNVKELDVATGEEDIAAVFDLSVGYQFPGTSGYELEAGYDFYQSLYEKFSEYNLQSHSVHLGGSREMADLDVGLVYRYTFSRLDNESFLGSHNLQPSLGYSVQPNWYLSLAYNYEQRTYDDDPERDGRQHGLSLDNYVVFSDNKSYVRIGYRYEDENTDGPQYDYKGQYFNGGLSTPLKLVSRDVKLDLSYQYYDKNYSNVTPSIGRERSDERHTYGLKATVDLSDYLFASLAYEYVDATSNLSSADYSENIVTLSLGRNW